MHHTSHPPPPRRRPGGRYPDSGCQKAGGPSRGLQLPSTHMSLSNPRVGTPMNLEATVPTHVSVLSPAPSHMCTHTVPRKRRIWIRQTRNQSWKRNQAGPRAGLCKTRLCVMHSKMCTTPLQPRVRQLSSIPGDPGEALPPPGSLPGSPSLPLCTGQSRSTTYGKESTQNLFRSSRELYTHNTHLQTRTHACARMHTHTVSSAF